MDSRFPLACRARLSLLFGSRLSAGVHGMAELSPPIPTHRPPVGSTHLVVGSHEAVRESCRTGHRLRVQHVYGKHHPIYRRAGETVTYTVFARGKVATGIGARLSMLRAESSAGGHDAIEYRMQKRRKARHARGRRLKKIS